MQILVPIAGESPFFKPEDYPFPKPLIEIGGTPMIQKVIENLATISDEAHFVFVANHEDVARYSLDSTLSLVAKGSEVKALRQPANGALCSCLMASDLIDETAPVIISNGDQVIDADLRRIVAHFLSTGVDAGVITFPSVHPRWSYVRLKNNAEVIQAAEKVVISRDAIAGFYFFRTAGLFMEAAKRCIISGASVNGQYYISASLNELILDGMTVGAYQLGAGAYHSFYSPAKIQEFEEARLMSANSAKAEQQQGLRVIIPAAGEGSRFRDAGYAKPKPFIDVLGRPMIQHVIENVLPAGAEAHIIVRAEHARHETEMVDFLQAEGCEVHEIGKLTEGTACTLLLQRTVFDDDRPMMVANSDQWVDFSVEDFVADCKARDLDGSILVFRDPGRNPKWSFAKVNEDGHVTEVAEKKPISDLATVGIYLFSKGSAFVDAAIDMIANNDRVNNEFYTCPVYNYMIKAGAKIGVYEVPAGAMHGLGTPADLDAFIAGRSKTVVEA